METFSITISPPTNSWTNYFVPRMLGLCKKLAKRGKVLYSEEIGSNSDVPNHGHILLEDDNRGKNLKRCLELHFKSYFTDLRDRIKAAGGDDLANAEWNTVLKIKKHDDPLKLIGYITKDWVDGEPKLQSFNTMNDDKEKWKQLWKKARDYNLEHSGTNIKGWKCKAVNAIFDFAVNWVKENTPKGENATKEDGPTRVPAGSKRVVSHNSGVSRPDGWKWDMCSAGIQYREYPDWNKVIGRLHTNGLIPTSLAVKVMRKEYKVLWTDYWNQEEHKDWISHPCFDETDGM